MNRLDFIKIIFPMYTPLCWIKILHPGEDVNNVTKN